MKSKFYKLLSLVLSVSLILSLCFISGMISVSAEEKVTDYYVGYSANGSGTGLTANSPVASVAEAVTLINANGLVAGDTANIWIVQDIEKPALTEEKTSGVAKHNLAYYGSVPEHPATIVIKPYEKNQTTNTSLTTTYLATSATMGKNDTMVLGGPTVFEDLYLLYTSNSNNHNYRSVWQLNGNSTKFGSGVKFGYIDKNSSNGYAWSGTMTEVKMPYIDLAKSSGTNTYTAPVYVELAVPNGAAESTNKFQIGSYGAGTHTFKEDVTIEFNHASQYGVQAVIGGNNASSISTFEKNLNFKVTAGKVVRFGSGSGTVTVKGAVQMIANTEVGYQLSGNPDASISTVASKFLDEDGNAADMWIVKTDANGVKYLDFIDGETGKFSVAKGYKATATNTSTGATEDSNSGVLDLSDAAGEYTVTFTEQAEKVYDYYVKAGGTGDGTSAENAAPTVAAAITKMNSLGLDETETANIWIMQSGMTDITCGDDMTHNMAYWGSTVEHKATVKIGAYEGNTYSGDVIKNTLLAISSTINAQGTLTFGGPTVIGNVQLVYTSASSFNAESKVILNLNGQDVTVTADAKFAYINANGNTTYASDYADTDKAGGAYKTVGWPDTVTSHFKSATLLNTWVTYNTGDNITYENPISVTINKGFSTTGDKSRVYVGASNSTFNEDVTVSLDLGTTNDNPRVRLGYSSYGSTFKKNLNFKLSSAKNFGFDPQANITVNGGVQLILSDAVSFHVNNPYTNIGSKAVDSDGNAADVWIVKSDAENIDCVNFVNGETGKFAVSKEGYTATAVNTDKTVIEKSNADGVIDLSGKPGEYTIYFAEEETETHNYDQGENPFINYRGFSEFSGVATADGATIDNNGALANTYKKLTQDKELNVVYFGGSVTNGTGSTDGGSWRARISDWLVNNFPAATVNNYNKAIGETGTYLGCYRVARDIVSVAPDLLFIEYSINDYYDKATYERASMQYETIVRAVKEAYPDCDIVTVLVTDSSVAKAAANGTLHTQAQAHEDIAQKYDITTLHVGRVFAEKVTAEGWTSGVDAVWSQYMTDIVHPNNVGYDVYFQVIKEFMANCLLFSNYGECTYDVEKQELPELVNKYLFDGNVTYIDESEVTFTTDGGSFYSPTMQGITYPDYEGLIRVPAGSQDIITVNFTGTELIMLVKAGNDEVNGNKYSVRIDGGEWVSYDYVDKNPLVIAKGLEDGAHVAEIKVSPEEVVIDTDYRISGFYSRSVVKATNKLSICDLVALDESATDTTLDERDYNNDDVIDTKDISTLKKILLNNK